MSEKEIQQLKEKINNLNITLEKMIKTNGELGRKLHDKEKQLQQRDSIIEEATKFVNKHRYQPSPLGFELELNPSQLWQLQNILDKRESDNKNGK